jgi:aminopeptidase-like protein
VVEFEPWGGDERQFCSPGFDLPLGALTRTAHAADPANHTSADTLQRIEPAVLEASVDVCLSILEVLETDRTCVNLSPLGEPQLGRRGLYRPAGGAVSRPEQESAVLWVLNLSDGSRTLTDIATRSGLAYGAVRQAAARLEQAGLLSSSPPSERRARHRC